MYITWDENLSVGIAELDSDHRDLLAILNDFFSSYYAGQGVVALDGILAKLIEHSKHHFDKEESLLEEHGYPSLSQHVNEHRKLIGQMERLEKSLRTETTPSLSNDTLKFLDGWLTDHIMGTDMGYKLHLTGLGER